MSFAWKVLDLWERVHAYKHKHTRELNKYSTNQTESNLRKSFYKNILIETL
jgi:hypothetical protein